MNLALLLTSKWIAFILSCLILLCLGSDAANAQRTRSRTAAPKPRAKPEVTENKKPAEKSGAVSRELWVNIYGATVMDLWVDAASSTTVYAGTHRGLFKTANGGLYWEAIITSDRVRSELKLNGRAEQINLAPSDPNVLYAIEHLGERYSGRRNLYKSEDGGFSWRALDISRLIQEAQILSIAVTRQSSKILYLAVDDLKEPLNSRHGSLLVSADGGDNWRNVSGAIQAANATLPSAYYWVIVVDPNDSNVVYVVTGFTGNAVLRSRDRGLIWSSITLPMSIGRILDLAVSPKSSNTLYLASERGVWLSTNAGRTWQSYNRGLNGDGITRLIATNSVVIAQGANGIYRLSDENLTWAADAWKRAEKSR